MCRYVCRSGGEDSEGNKLEDIASLKLYALKGLEDGSPDHGTGLVLSASVLSR